MTKKPGWGPVRPWTCLGQILPADVKPGDLIRSDLIVRADHLSYSRSQGRPDYHASCEWPFVNGSAFMEKLPHFNHGTHMVASWYQVWQGSDPEDADLDMTADEERLLEVLLEAMRAPEVEMETTTEGADR